MKFKLSPLFLLLALICFALPFVEVSCENENPTPKAGETKTTLSDSLKSSPADSSTTPNAVPDSAKPAPKPAKPTPPEIVKLYTYTGLNMVLGTNPRNHLLENAPAKSEQKKESGKPVKDSLSKADPKPETKPEAVKPASPEKSAQPAANEDKGPQNTRNIYALIAFGLILIALLLSLFKAPIMAVFVALLAFVSTLMLYMLKLYFPGYFLAYSQLDAQALQILTIKFSLWYWAAFALPLLAMVESMWRFARSNPKPEIMEPVALDPMPDYDENGDLISPVEAIDPTEPIEPTEPTEPADPEEEDESPDLPAENEQEKQ